MSKTAEKLLSDEMRSILLKYYDKIITADLTTSEKVGGSSLECITQPIPFIWTKDFYFLIIFLLPTKFL